MAGFLEALRTQHTPSWEIQAVLLAFLAFVLLLLLFSYRNRVTSERHRRRQVRRAFLAICRDRRLQPEERALLLRADATQDLDQALARVQFNTSFDQFAHRIICEAEEVQVPALNTLLSNLRVKLGFRPPARGLSLNSTRELPVGQLLYLLFSRDFFLEGMVSEVDETQIIAHITAGMTGHFPLTLNLPVRIFFSRAGDARYSGTCFLLKTTSDGEGFFFTLNHSEELKRDQRRQDFRADDNRPLKVWVVGDDQEAVNDFFQAVQNHAPQKATLEDLSGGGASIIFARELPVHQRLYIDLDPDRESDLPLVCGTVIRASRRGGLACWGISVRFEDLRPSERQKLVRYVFLKEREILKAI